MDTKIDIIIDTDTTQSEFNRLFSQYEVHYIRKKVILLFKLSNEINESDFSHTHMNWLLTNTIDGLKIEAYTRVPDNASIQARTKHFQNRGAWKDIFLLCIGAITMIACVAIVQGNKFSFWHLLAIVILALWLVLFMQRFLSLTKYGLKSIRRRG